MKFLKKIDRETPKQKTLQLIAGNYATHKHPVVQEWLAKHPRFVMHFTPTSASWLNRVQNRRFEEGVGPFTGTLPLGLRLDMTQSEVIERLDEPTSSMEFLGGFFLTYDGLFPELTVNIRLDLATRIIHFVRFMPVEL